MTLRKLIEDLKQRAIEVGVHSDPARPQATAEVCAALANAEAALIAHLSPAAEAAFRANLANGVGIPLKGQE